ncbi:MAG: pilus assembly protein PilM [Bdellovibrionales bacterium]|nr:pilus assembly protein PilM [Bdellovibrionales bacterium]
MKSIGIDIGSYSVKISEVVQAGREPELVRFIEQPISQDPNKDKKIEVLDFIRQYLDRLEDDQYKIIVGVKQNHVTHRLIQFPFRERHNILKSLAFELEEDIPFNQENAIFDAKVVEYAGQMSYVQATACPKNQIEHVLTNCTDFGFEPDILSVEGLAFANLFEDWLELPPEKDTSEVEPPNAQNTHVILNIGHDHSFLLFYKQKSLVAVRSLYWGTQSIAQQIHLKYKLPFSEAVKELNKKGFVVLSEDGHTKDQVAFSNLIKTEVDKFSHQLRLIIMEVKSDLDLHITSLSYCGGGSQIKNLGGYLTQSLEVACNPLAPKPKYVVLKTKQFNPVSGLLSLGYAIEGLKKPRNPATNLLKQEFAKKNTNLQNFWKKWSFSIKTAAAVYVLFFMFAIIRGYVAESTFFNAETVLLEKTKEVTGERRVVVARLQSTIRRYLREQKKVQSLNQLRQELKTINSALDVMNNINNNMPAKNLAKVQLEKFYIKNDQVTMQGYSTAQINTIINSLNNIALGKVERFKPEIASKSGVNAFGLRFKVSRQRDN